MNDVNWEKVVYGLRGILAVLFLVGTGAVYLYSQFTDKALTIDTVQGILAVLLPYFGLDALVSYNQVKKE